MVVFLLSAGNGSTADGKDAMSSTVRLDKRPTCDVCGVEPAHVDAVTDNGKWGYLCEPCWGDVGMFPGRTGTGIGQRIITDDD